MHQNEKGNFMSLYTIVFIFVTILIITGLASFGILISKIDKWIDKKERLGRQSVIKNEKREEKK
ncbi:MAG: hypothetical protein HZA74_04935 [Ignavibacteriales bacterium]|nr:hypothetical protein [Ignavibacteriales bacterium]